jgi:hypothetical protein
MPDERDELRILVHESARADFLRRYTRRQALVAGAGTALAAYLAACGGKTSSGGGGGGGGGRVGGGGGGGGGGTIVVSGVVTVTVVTGVETVIVGSPFPAASAG